MEHTRSPEEHEQHLRIRFKQLQPYGILLKPSKCFFQAAEITFLEYRISGKGKEPLPHRVDDLQACPPPQKIRRFLEMLKLYRRFLLHAAATQAPYTPSSPAVIPGARNPSPGHQSSGKPSKNARTVYCAPPCWLTRTAFLLLPW
jgi:hypothetical protein